MRDNNTPLLEPTIAQQNGPILVTVPWACADRFQELLKARGISSTLHLDPAAREARLELWTNIAPDRIRALLAEVASSLPAADARAAQPL